jgi:hypothetical protein
LLGRFARALIGRLILAGAAGAFALGALAAAFLAAAGAVAALLALRVGFALAASAGRRFLIVRPLLAGRRLLPFVGRLHVGLRIGRTLIGLRLIAGAGRPFRRSLLAAARLCVLTLLVGLLVGVSVRVPGTCLSTGLLFGAIAVLSVSLAVFASLAVR